MLQVILMTAVCILCLFSKLKFGVWLVLAILGALLVRDVKLAMLFGITTTILCMLVFLTKAEMDFARVVDVLQSRPWCTQFHLAY